MFFEIKSGRYFTIAHFITGRVSNPALSIIVFSFLKLAILMRASFDIRDFLPVPKQLSTESTSGVFLSVACQTAKRAEENCISESSEENENCKERKTIDVLFLIDISSFRAIGSRLIRQEFQTCFPVFSPHVGILGNVFF